jgi:hypothetical protein
MQSDDAVFTYFDSIGERHLLRQHSTGEAIDELCNCKLNTVEATTIAHLHGFHLPPQYRTGMTLAKS